MPTGTSFEADLRAAREAADYSLSDIQQKTRIPVDVLRRFEEGSLVGDPTYNEVYLKAFIQSYAKAVGVSPSAALAGYTEQRAGHYSGALHPTFDAGAAPSAPPARPSIEEPAPVSPASPAAAAPAAPPSGVPPSGVPPSGVPPSGVPPSGVPPSGVPPAVQALTSRPETQSRPADDDRPKTLAQARVNRPVVTTAKHSFDKNWGTILGLFGVLVVGLAAALYFLVFAGDSDDVAETPNTIVVGDTGAETPIDSSGVGTGAASGGPQLQLPIEVVVTAQNNGLQSFRVTEDAGDRRPYWLEAGNTQTFEADSSLVLWGEGDSAAFVDAVIEIQGLRFTPRDGQVIRIDRQRGQALLDSLSAAGPTP